jgi:hypothetical protein
MMAFDSRKFDEIEADMMLSCCKSAFIAPNYKPPLHGAHTVLGKLE